ncbi:uncharacterized protein K441DRAFT_533489, partial [Cenococcum geophilum 1.58]|uniref:uncharacterized protein n=1 Tax=Cenococcum geophilum 1.58 TaxID=794803 RepID=UPI00358F5EC8
KGKAFYIEKGKPSRLSINSWIIVNPVLFRENNLNYTKPSINKQRKYRTNDIWTICFNEPAKKKLNKVKSNGKEPTELKYKDLFIYSPTILGFSLNNKL